MQSARAFGLCCGRDAAVPATTEISAARAFHDPDGPAVATTPNLRAEPPAQAGAAADRVLVRAAAGAASGDVGCVWLSAPASTAPAPAAARFVSAQAAAVVSGRHNATADGAVQFDHPGVAFRATFAAAGCDVGQAYLLQNLLNRVLLRGDDTEGEELDAEWLEANRAAPPPVSSAQWHARRSQFGGLSRAPSSSASICFCRKRWFWSTSCESKILSWLTLASVRAS